MSKTALKRAANHRMLEHLLFAGKNPIASTAPAQRTANPSLVSSPLNSWLGSVGRADDVANGYRILPGGLASGYQHDLIAYTSDGVDRCFALGRNEAAQLGLGYNSQEPTRGLVEGFRGDGIIAVKAACQSSYMLLSEDQGRTALYVFGSLERGRLGHSAFSPPDRDDERERELATLAKATLVDFPEGPASIKQLAVGFEHLLLLSDSGEVWGSGCSTDGQLARDSDAYELTKLSLPPQVGVVESIHAGADTSALLTADGRLWTWGNSEYAQAGHGKKIDQVLSPKQVDLGFLPPSRRVVDFRCGGSFSLILDDHGSCYSVGFGALGLGREVMESPIVQVVPKLEGQGITRIRAGWGWAAAIRDAGTSSALYTFGVNNTEGRLGIGAVPNEDGKRGSIVVPAQAYEPTAVPLPLRELGLVEDGAKWELGEVELGEGTLWVSVLESCNEP